MKVLTISVAAYNAEQYIRKTLESLCCQNVSKIEVFVIDDGGSDGTLEIAREFEKKYPNSFYAIHKENGGLGSTYNYSIKNGTGKFLKLLDADDYFDTGELDKLIETLEKVDADAIYTPFVIFDDKTGGIIDIKDVSKSHKQFELIELLKLKSYAGLEMHSTTFKLKMLRESNISILEKCFYTDTEYKTKALFFSKNILYTDYLVYHYRMGRDGQSVDIVGLRKHFKECVKVSEELLSFYVNNENSPNSNVILYNLNAMLRFTYNTLIKLGNKKEFVSFDKKVRDYKIDDKITIDRRVKLIRYSNYFAFDFIRSLLELNGR